MSLSETSAVPKPFSVDLVSNILKWVLLAVAILRFALFAWATVVTYERAPPQPERLVTAAGQTLMTDADIVAGKAGFQRADLMDYGSLYGMGSYYGQDYTAWALIRLAGLVENNLATANLGKSYDALAPDQQASIRDAMRAQLQRLDLTQHQVTISDALASAITTLRGDISTQLVSTDLDTGWTPAYSLSAEDAARTADFLIYSALTTVGRRPGISWSWTENWPYEPEVGNTPTTNTFVWTWASFCFTFFAFGLVLFIYEFWLNHPDDAPMDPVLARFGPLTESQRKIGKYFLVVVVILLLQIAAGTIMAHAYYDRRSFYGIALHEVLPFNFLRDIHIQSPIIWIGVSWIGAGLFLAPAIAGNREARGQGFLVDLLVWVTLIIVAGALIGNWLGIMGYIDQGWFWFGNQGLSYIQLGRFWQIGFFVGLVVWSLLMFRALWPTSVMLWQATREFWSGRIRLEHLIWAATINIATLYVFGMIPLTGVEKSFTITDFWRWWVVHLWVEQSFEFFAASMSAYLLMALPAHGGRFGVTQARRVRGVFRTDPDLPRRRDRHRPPSLLGGWPEHVGANGQHVRVHRGAAACAANHRGDRAVSIDQGTPSLQLSSRLHIHHRRGVLEFCRGRRVRRRHLERAADQLL